MQHANDTTTKANTAKKEQWKLELSNAITSPIELLSLLKLDKSFSGNIINTPQFKLRVPHHFVRKMQSGNCNDPLLRQVIPLTSENETSGFLDPVGDMQAMPTPGLHHKYHGRALMITTGACAIHCRYCFRRHYPYEQANTNQVNLANTLEYLKAHNEIKEVILSGGDPLVMDDQKIAGIIHSLEQVSHLKWLRIHTRLPVVLPSRITKKLISILQNSRFRTTMVIHCNHENELGEDEASIFQQMQQAGITLLNQSVLLNGVNDDAYTLIRLSEKLYEYGVLPYYLHCFDPVQGAMHFDVNLEKATSIMTEMRNHLPGFLVPKLVKEEQGKPSKTVIFSI